MMNSSQNLPTMLPPTPVEHVPSIVTIQNPQGVNFKNGHKTQTLLTRGVNQESTPTCGSVSSVSDNEELNVPPLTCVSDKTYSDTTNTAPLNRETAPSLPQSNDEEDLNDIFDDDFFQLLSDDPVASGFNEQETSSMPIHSSTSTFEPSMNQQQLPKIRSENVEQSQVLAYPHSVTNSSMTPNIAAISVSSSKDNEESTTEAENKNKRKRKNLTAEQKADGRR